MLALKNARPATQELFQLTNQGGMSQKAATGLEFYEEINITVHSKLSPSAYYSCSRAGQVARTGRSGRVAGI